MFCLRAIIIFTILLGGVLSPISAYSQSRENPFGALTFLPWNESFNNYMYDSDEKVIRAIAILKELGVSIIRVDFAWSQIEAAKGEDKLERLDLIARECEKNHIEILGVLGYSPPWTGSQWNQPPKDLNLFADFCSRMASRYEQIKYWEIWNEPDSVTYWQPQDDMVVYSKLLKASYLAIKTANPKTSILLGGLTDDGLYKLKNLLRLGGGDYFDIINIHPFVDPLDRDGIRRMGALISNFYKAVHNAGFEKKVWVTEIGCPGRDDSKQTWWNGRSPDEVEQADFLRRAYECALNDPNVDKVFWAFFQDTPDHFHDAVDDFGLIRADFSKKRSFATYQEIIRTWGK
jgi:hypothetical protein